MPITRPKQPTRPRAPCSRYGFRPPVLDEDEERRARKIIAEARRLTEETERVHPPYATTLRPFCNMFGLARTRVYELQKAGVLTRKKNGGRSLWLIAEGQAYVDSLDSGPRKPTAPGRSATRNIAAKKRATK